MGLHKEEEQRMVWVGMVGVYIYILYIVANEWLGYCIAG
jgi:hypothetical protein